MAGRDLNHSWSRSIAAVLGTLPCALAVSALLTRVLPLALDVRLAIGGYGVFLLWGGLACWVFLAPSGGSAWWRVALVGLPAVAVAGLVLAFAGPPTP